jgi:class 3 adenylate cyclase/tetratricopeptide (TPR) repeat protein
MELDGAVATGVALAPYVPRLAIEWLRETPDAEWRELHGTMAFVDISGFTAMSEKLAGEGKAGAEQVTDVMNATFGALLGVAYAYGGGLLKFGGDALLLFFDGEEHAARAARAAHEMRKTLRAIGRPKTTAGTVTLKMHVGIHSGEFLFVLAGVDHRELIVTGPAASATVRMEAAAQAGEIAVSAATANLLPHDVLGEQRDGGFLLASAPVATLDERPLPPLDDLLLVDCVPRLVRSHLTSGVSEPEHRQAAVAFIRLAGTDALVASEGSAAAASAVAEVVEAVQDAAAEHEVCFLESDIDHDGARIVLVAGAPQVSEHDVERMLRTVRAAVDVETELPLSIGVSRGRVFAGEVGAPFRRTYTILGGTAALAARLMAKAAPRQILVPGDLLDASATLFGREPVEPLRLKGLAEPVHAVSLGAIEGVRDAAGTPAGPLLGRERELAVMGAALGPVRLGFGTVLELVGEAGVGKSRLLDEFKTTAAADLVRAGARCDEYESSTPYFVFRNLLRPLVPNSLEGTAEENAVALQTLIAGATPQLAPWLPLVGLVLDVDVGSTPEVDELEPAFRRARLHGVLEELLKALLPSPTLGLFEDVHWIDEASSELLRHLGATNAVRPWAICCTRRPGDEGFVAANGVPPIAAMTILLEPLRDEAAAELVRRAAGDALDDAAVAAIVARAAGNPLFLRALVASAGDGAPEDLPDTVGAVVGTRIDRLSPADRALLRWASVLGVVFDGEVIADVLEGDPAAAAGSEAWERLAEFIERDPYVAGGFRFRHALIRDAAYEGLPFRRRRELHARVGEVVEARHADAPDEVAELLSLHFSLAGDSPRTWRYALLAGERAREKFANVEAAAFYRRALEAASSLSLDDAEQAAVWEALADVCAPAGRLKEAQAALARARSFSPAAAQARLMLKEGLLREEQGSYADALRWYTRGERAAAAIPDANERARSEVELIRARAQARFRQGRYDQALAHATEVIERAMGLHALRDLAHAYYLSHMIHTFRGDEERHAFRGLALPIFEEVGDLVGQASVLNNLGIESYYEGRWDEARDLYERSRALRERIGDAINVATTTNNIGEIESDQGRFDDAERSFRETLAIVEPAGQRLLTAVARGNLGRVAARQRRFADAEELLSGARVELGEIGAAPFAVEQEARLAELGELRRDDPEQVLRAADAAIVQLEAAGAPAALRVLLERVRGTALARAARLGEARETLERALEIAERASADYETALTLRALTRLDGTESQRAKEIFARLGVDADALP